MIRKAIVLAAFAALALMAQVATAQEASPEAQVVPDPSLCTIDPMTMERLETILMAELIAATPLSESGAGTPVALPDGDPVSPEVQQSVEEAMVVNIACINSGETLRQMAIYTDMGIKRVLGASVTSISEDEFAALATPRPVTADNMTVIIEFGDAIDLGNGRVAIVVVGDDLSQPDPPSPTLFVLVEQGGHWFVDSFERTED